MTVEQSKHVYLYAPRDWFDLMEDGPDVAATEARCLSMVRRSYPGMSAERHSDLARALLAFHENLLASGVLLYGVASGEFPETDVVGQWQVFGGVVDLPEMDQDINIGALLERGFGVELNSDSYTESFSTDLGSGFGFITQPVIKDDDPESTSFGLEQQLGIAGTLTYPPHGGRGILFVGMCLAGDQVLALAALLAQMAGKSSFTEPQEGTDDDWVASNVS